MFKQVVSVCLSVFWRKETILVSLACCLLLSLSVAADPVDQQDRRTGGFAFPPQIDSRNAADQLSVVDKRARVFALVPFGERTLAVGSRGLALVADSNSGKNRWSSIEVAGAPNLYAGLRDSSGSIWLASDAGQLYLGNAELKSWDKVDLQEDSSVYAITELENGGIIAIGQYGLIKKRSVEDNTWEAVKLPWDEWLKPAWQELGEAMPNLFGTCQSGGSLFLVGEFGLVLKYDGRTWVKLHGGTIEPALYSCAVRGDQLFAAGQRGIMLRSGDAGQSWSTKHISSSSIFKIITLSADYWLAVGEERKIWWLTSLNSVWKCGRVDSMQTGWFVDALYSSGGMSVTLAGAGVLRLLKLDASGAPMLQRAFTCG